MVDRLRALLDRPLDSRVSRGIVVLATAVSLGFAALVVLVLGAEAVRPVTDHREPRPVRIAASSVLSVKGPADRRPQQDPQDVPGSPAMGRARQALRSHRALQLVPYRRGHLRIELVGSRDGRAVLRVSATSVAQARSGWRDFLRRANDRGKAYSPLFVAVGGRRG